LRNLVLIFFLSTIGQNFAQDVHFPCDLVHYEEHIYKDSLPFYEHNFAETIRFQMDDERLKLAVYVALRHYPELKKVPISFGFKKIKATMMAQPRWTFIFQSRKERHYQILVNHVRTVNGMYFKDLSFNSLVGWVGHELAHILDYSKKSNKQLLAFITKYVSSEKTLKHTENEADKETIRRGLGKQLLEGTNFLFNNQRVSKAYKEKKKKFYLTPEQIAYEIEHQCEGKK
jgi:hypothetical protein